MSSTADAVTPPSAAPPPPLGARTLAELWLGAAARRPGAVALRQPGDAERTFTYAELGAAAREIAAGLAALGIEPGDRVALLAATRAEWTLCDAGVACAGAVLVPLYPTSSPQECRHVLADSGARAILCEGPVELAKVAAVRDDCPRLEHTIAIDATTGGALSLTALRERGRTRGDDGLAARRAAVSPDDAAAIVYTSGTTGPPKGCVLTHANWLTTTAAYLDRVRLGEREVTLFLFLPLAHVLARVAQLVVVAHGGTIAFWSGDPGRVVDELAQARPTHVPAVPRVLEKVQTQARATAQAGGAARLRLFDAAIALGRRAAARRRTGHRLPPALRLALPVADRLVLRRVRAVFGDRLELLLVGAAPTGLEVLSFFEACGIVVAEGYGLTESTAAATLNAPGAMRLGSVGRPLAGCEARVAPGGEVLLRGPNVFAGYWQDDDATRDALDADGWLRTGDLGRLDADGYLHVTGRLKDLIVTAGGKNVSPAAIEAALRESRWISQAVAFGDRRPHLVAAVTLDPDELERLAERTGLEADAATLASAPEVHALLEADVGLANAAFAPVAQIKRFAILPRELTEADGELTPTLKVKRAVVYDRYGDVFAGLYADG